MLVENYNKVMEEKPCVRFRRAWNSLGESMCLAHHKRAWTVSAKYVTYESMGFNLGRLNEQRECHSESLAKKRSRLSSATTTSMSV